MGITNCCVVINSLRESSCSFWRWNTLPIFLYLSFCFRYGLPIFIHYS